MVWCGRGDEDAVKVAGVQHGVDIGIVGKAPPPRSDWIGDGGDPDRIADGEGAEMGAAHAAGANQA